MNNAQNSNSENEMSILESVQNKIYDLNISLKKNKIVRKIIAVLTLMSFLQAFSQVGINTETPDPSSILELDSNNGGLLIPRMTEAQVNSIFQPARSLMVFNLDRN